MVSKIDDLGMVLVASAIRDIMSWSTGDSLQVVPNPSDGIVILKPIEE